jgi:DNA-binding CsgD family transcriptional regulator
MVLLDSERRYVDANRPARLALRLSLDQLRGTAIEDLTPPEHHHVVDEAWAELLATGSAAGRRVTAPDGCPLEIVYCGVADALPGLHVGAFAPAGWPDDELDVGTDDSDDPPPLTRREIEVLTLAAYGRSGPQIAEELTVSTATVKTHFANIHGKLGVPNRTAAVALAMKLGLID